MSGCINVRSKVDRRMAKCYAETREGSWCIEWPSFHENETSPFQNLDNEAFLRIPVFFLIVYLLIFNCLSILFYIY